MCFVGWLFGGEREESFCFVEQSLLLAPPRGIPNKKHDDSPVLGGTGNLAPSWHVGVIPPGTLPVGIQLRYSKIVEWLVVRNESGYTPPNRHVPLHLCSVSSSRSIQSCSSKVLLKLL